jgi:hypothetical protein
MMVNHDGGEVPIRTSAKVKPHPTKSLPLTTKNYDAEWMWKNFAYTIGEVCVM